MNYGAEIFGNHECKNIEKIHCKFLRKVLCVKTNTNLDGVFGELGRFPMYMRRNILMITYWLKIISSNDSSIIKLTYNMLLNDANDNNNYTNLNWAYHIIHILNEIGMSTVWDNQYNLNTPKRN